MTRFTRPTPDPRHLRGDHPQFGLRRRRGRRGEPQLRYRAHGSLSVPVGGAAGRQDLVQHSDHGLVGETPYVGVPRPVRIGLGEIGVAGPAGQRSSRAGPGAPDAPQQFRSPPHPSCRSPTHTGPDDGFLVPPYYPAAFRTTAPGPGGLAGPGKVSRRETNRRDRTVRRDARRDARRARAPRPPPDRRAAGRPPPGAGPRSAPGVRPGAAAGGPTRRRARRAGPGMRVPSGPLDPRSAGPAVVRPIRGPPDPLGPQSARSAVHSIRDPSTARSAARSTAQSSQPSTSPAGERKDAYERLDRPPEGARGPVVRVRGAPAVPSRPTSAVPCERP